MPQLAPLSWVFLSVYLFFALSCMVSFVWWMKKSPLVIEDSGVLSRKETVWLW